MFRIAICDDQELHLAIVHKALEHYLSEKRLEAEIQDFTSAFDLVSSSENGAFYDIVILDICLPGLSGTEAAKEIMQRNSNVSLIFLSVSRDYAVEAFAIGAVHYLLKPFTDEEFSEAMDRAVSRKGMAKHLMVNTAGGHVEAVDVDSKYAKQSGGRGQYGHCKVRFEPMDPNDFVLKHKLDAPSAFRVIRLLADEGEIAIENGKLKAK